jgi:hypothetical protein
VLFRLFVLAAVCGLVVPPGLSGASSESRAVGAGFPRVHPISITQIDAFVNRSRMTTRCTFYADDLEMLHEVWPDEVTGFYNNEDLLEAYDEHAALLLEKIEIVDAAGNRLTGKLVEKSPFELPDGGIESGALMDYQLTITYEFEFAEPPEFLTFRHEINDPNFTRPAEVKLLVKQAGSDVGYSANMKERTPETVRFDWSQPLSQTASGEEVQAWFDRQREATLGITSYGGVYSFVYITPRETRQEILIPLAILVSEVRLEQADPSYLEVEEQQKALPAIREFFTEATPLKINGAAMEPRFDRIDFGGLDIRDFALQRDPVRVSMANGRVGVIMSYPTQTTPDRVEVSWTRFNQKFLRDVDMVAFTPGETQKTQFSVYLADNTWTWENPGLPPLPEVVPVAAAAGQVEAVRTPLPLIAMTCIGVAFGGLIVSLLGQFHLKHLAIFLVVMAVATAATWQFRFPVRLPGSAPPTLPAEEAKGIFGNLLANMFRAFDYSTEEDVYDSLAASTTGPMLREVYLKMRKSLEIQEQGGAVAVIDKVEILNGEPSPEPAQNTGDGKLNPPSFAWRAEWSLSGTVEHWGHIHRRTNRYEAIFNVQVVDGTWKFSDYQTLDEHQGPVIRSLRKF